MTTTPVKNSERMMSSAIVLDKGIEITFVDGCSGVIPFSDLPEVAASGGLKDLELTSPFEAILTTARGDRSQIPWDFARAYCDKTYRPRIVAEAKQAREILGKRIQDCRETAGLTQAELATRAAISTAKLNLIEEGQHSPATEHLADIAHALDAEVIDFMLPADRQRP